MEKKILYVDDEEEMLLTVASLLKEAGYSVVTARDATEAMKQAEDVTLGLLLLDLNLAGEDGVMLMRFFRRNHPDVPIIIYTGQEHDEAAVAKLLQQGAHQYVRKGPNQRLLEAVQRSFR